MKLHHGYWYCGIGIVAGLLLCLVSETVSAQRVLFHGREAGPTFGDDGAVLAHLESLYGASNVMYLQGATAAADGSSANGFDAVVLSSTLDSGSVRDKYDDIAIGVLQWEQALVHDNNPGNFFFSDAGAENTGMNTQIDILDPSHPIAAGVPSGTVDVLGTGRTFMVGTGDLGPGVTRVAAPTGDTAQHAILAADVGDELRGGLIAQGRRVHFFLHDVGFADLTPVGLQLFNNSLNYVLNVSEPFVPGDFNDDGMVNTADYDILVNNLGGHLDGPVGRAEGDINFDGKINLVDFGEFKSIFPGGLGQGQAIPEPATMALLVSALGVVGLVHLRRQRG